MLASIQHGQSIQNKWEKKVIESTKGNRYAVYKDQNVLLTYKIEGPNQLGVTFVQRREDRLYSSFSK